jgi:hypothetical protein
MEKGSRFKPQDQKQKESEREKIHVFENLMQEKHFNGNLNLL